MRLAQARHGQITPVQGLQSRQNLEIEKQYVQLQELPDKAAAGWQL